MLVGKGICYDTGGADIKAGGVMAGMHRDKCGAAAVGGFFKVCMSCRQHRCWPHSISPIVQCFYLLPVGPVVMVFPLCGILFYFCL